MLGKADQAADAESAAQSIARICFMDVLRVVHNVHKEVARSCSRIELVPIRKAGRVLHPCGDGHNVQSGSLVIFQRVPLFREVTDASPKIERVSYTGSRLELVDRHPSGENLSKRVGIGSEIAEFSLEDGVRIEGRYEPRQK